MIPKIRFTYSDIYEVVLSKKTGMKFDHKKRILYEKLVRKLQTQWDKKAAKILMAMSETTKLKWKTREIECFLSSETNYSFSYPLTIEFKIGWSFNYLIVYLVHELSHQLFWSNKKKVSWPKDNVWIKEDFGIYKKYSKEKYNTKLHLPVHALLILVIKKVFGKNAEEYLKWERWWEHYPDTRGLKSKDYKRSWEIVQKEGPEKILIEIIKS